MNEAVFLDPQHEKRVLFLAPNAKDASLTHDLLSKEGIASEIFSDMPILCKEIQNGAGAVLLSEGYPRLDESLDILSMTLRDQPGWSDLPIVLISSGGIESRISSLALKHLNNILLLNRPIHIPHLLSAMRTALRTRQRQYEIRDYLIELQRSRDDLHESEKRLRSLTATLEYQVEDRTRKLYLRNQQLRKLAYELTTTEQRERKYLATLLHDHLQQFLVASQMKLHQVKRKISNPELEERMQQIHDLLNESIQLARSLTMQLRPPVIYEAGLLSALNWLAKNMQEKHGLKVNIQGEDSGKELPDIERVLLFDCMRELLFNVVKHAGVNDATLIYTSDSDRIGIQIIDEGRGFDYKKISDARMEAKSYGLLSVQERIISIGGDIEFFSSPGKGTNVKISFPIVQETHSEESVEIQKRELKPFSSEETARIRILLIDDHKMVREGIAGILEDHPDIEIAGQAENGQEGLLLAEIIKPDVVVVDVNMPVMNGIETTREMRKRWKDIAIVGLSVQDESGTAETMRQAGANDYLYKGGDPEELIQAVQRAYYSCQRTSAVANDFSAHDHPL